jgi:hypothetical protein
VEGSYAEDLSRSFINYLRVVDDLLAKVVAEETRRVEIDQLTAT